MERLRSAVWTERRGSHEEKMRLFMERHEALPDIDIAVTIDERTFLERISDLGQRSGRFTVERYFDAMGEAGFDVINFRPTNPSPETDVGGQLIAWPDRPRRIAIEMRGSQWSPSPPNRASYSSAARDAFFPLLQAYNRQFGTRYRIRVTREPRPFHLPPHSAELLARFLATANRSGLHTLDWQRFYDFARHGRKEIPEAMMRTFLVQAGFSDRDAGRLADIYVHLLAFRRHYRRR
jgi:hypothetical protein